MAAKSLDKYYECHTNELIKIASACLSLENLEQLFLVKSCSSALRRANGERSFPMPCMFLPGNRQMCSLANSLLDDIIGFKFLSSQLLYEFACIIGEGVVCDHVNIYRSAGKEKPLELYVPENAPRSLSETTDDSPFPIEDLHSLAEQSMISGCALLSNVIVQTPLVNSSDRSMPAASVEMKDKQLSVMCISLTSLDGTFLCVVQLIRNWYVSKFMDDHLQGACCLATLLTTALEQSEAVAISSKQKQLNDFLLGFSQHVFSQMKSIEHVVEKIMMSTKELVNADRCAMFLVDEKTNELYSCLLDEGQIADDGTPVFVKANIRFSIDKGIAGAVARTGEIINIEDAYTDERFNREIDMDTGYRTKSILCMPILKEGQVMGVVEMVNKLIAPGCFTSWDMEAFRLLAIYCNLALQFTKLYKHLEIETAQQKVAMEQLSFHYCASGDEVATVLQQGPSVPVDELPSDIDSYYFDCLPFEEKLPQMAITLFKKLLGPNSIDVPTTVRFLLSLRKNYRSVPYHNFIHAWTVFHCMYCSLWEIRNTHFFTPNQKRTLLIAAICHDVDHRGFTNSFLKKFDEPLAKLYKTSVMERHHYDIAIKIMQENGHDVLQDLPRTEYKQMLDLMRHAIVATDLAVYAVNIKRLSSNVTSQAFRLTNHDHWLDAISMLMTSADICAVCKPWNVMLRTVTSMYEEFYHQGDVEIQFGEKPDPMFDRSRVMKLPDDQIAFIKNICIPCYGMLAKIFPSTQPLLLGCRMTLEHWEMILMDPNRGEWKPSDVLTINPRKSTAYLPRRNTRTSKMFF